MGLETSNLREVLGSMFVSSAKHPIDRAPFMLVSIPIPQKVNSIATNGLMIHNDPVLFQAREASLAAFCFTTHLGLFGNRVCDWCMYIYIIMLIMFVLNMAIQDISHFLNRRISSRFFFLCEEVLLSFCSMCITYLVVLLEAPLGPRRFEGSKRA